MSGDHPLPSLCVKHLRGKDRVVVGFVDDQAWVLLVGPHQAGDEATDVYSRLYGLLGFEVPEGERSKPSCCDGTGDAPVLLEIETDTFNGRL